MGHNLNLDGSNTDHDHANLCVARAQVSSVAEFLHQIETLQRPRDALLKVQSPCLETLNVIHQAQGPFPHSHELSANPSLMALLSGIPRRTLIRISYRYTLYPHCLTIRHSRTEVHNCMLNFTYKFLSNLLGILSADELKDVRWGSMNICASMKLQDGFVQRTREYRALGKHPEIALTHWPGYFQYLYADEKEGQEKEKAWAEPPWATLPSFPHVIIETGYKEPYADLLDDIADYLITSRGKMKVAILLYVEHPHPADQQQHPFPWPPSPPISSDSLRKAIAMQLSTPYSTEEEYDLLYAAAMERAVADAYIPGLTAFVEAWEYAPNTTTPVSEENNENGSAAAYRHIALRAPGRSYIMHAGVRQKNPGIMICREDFGLTMEGNAEAGAERAAMEGAGQADPNPHMVYVSFAGLSNYLNEARHRLVYHKLVVDSEHEREERRLRGEGKARNSGDLGREEVEVEVECKEEGAEEDEEEMRQGREKRVKTTQKELAGDSIMTQRYED